MPPALFTVGTLDPLLDDTLFMRARWATAGIESELEVYPGAVHSFNDFPTDQAEQANSRINRFITDTFNGRSNK
jgi:acetyl esterase/lipase